MKKYKRLSANEGRKVIKPIVEGESSYSAGEKTEILERSKLRDWVRKYRKDEFSALRNGKSLKMF